MKIEDKKSSEYLDQTCFLLSLKTVMEITGKSRSTLYRWEADSSNGFPSKITIGPNSVAFRKDDIAAWIDSLSRGDC